MLRISKESSSPAATLQVTQPLDNKSPHHVSESADIAEIEKYLIFANDASLYSDLASSTDKLLFINFTPSHTMQPRWYLVQIDINLSTDAEKA